MINLAQHLYHLHTIQEGKYKQYTQTTQKQPQHYNSLHNTSILENEKHKYDQASTLNGRWIKIQKIIKFDFKLHVMLHGNFTKIIITHRINCDRTFYFSFHFSYICKRHFCSIHVHQLKSIDLYLRLHTTRKKKLWKGLCVLKVAERMILWQKHMAVNLQETLDQFIVSREL